MKKETMEGLLKLAENEEGEMKAFLTRMAIGKPLFVAEISDGIFQWTQGLPEEFTYRVADHDIMEHDARLRDLEASDEVMERVRQEEFLEDIEEQVQICIDNILSID